MDEGDTKNMGMSRALIIVVAVLLVVAMLAGSVASIIALLAAAAGIFGLVMAIIAVVDLAGLVRAHNNGKWETADILWAISFFALQIIAPIIWLLVGRGLREADLLKARERRERESL